MTMLYAAGGMILVTLALIFAGWALLREGRRQGRELARIEQAERRAVRRAEVREATGRHRLTEFPGEAFEKLATTGELRAMAEAGDLAGLRRETTALRRIWDLRGHARMSA